MNRSMQDEPRVRTQSRTLCRAPTLLRAGAGGLAALASLSLGQRADAARGDPMHILCSGPAGSIPDLIARAVADQLFVTLGLRAVVDNRPGAAGQISVGALKGAAADGSTLLLAQGAIATVYPYLYAKLAYDPAVDLQPVSLASEMLLALAVGPAVPAEVATLADFIAWLRKHPERANIGSPGTGTLPHLLEAMLFRKAGVAWQHVAYSGGPPAVTDLLGGQIAALALPEGLLRQHHAAGRVRVLATSGPARSAYLPEVPSFVEQGHRRTGGQGVVRLLRLRSGAEGHRRGHVGGTAGGHCPPRAVGRLRAGRHDRPPRARRRPCRPESSVSSSTGSPCFEPTTFAPTDAVTSSSGQRHLRGSV